MLDVDYDSSDPATLFNLTVTEVAVNNGRRSVLRSETFRNLTMDDSAPNHALAVSFDAGITSVREVACVPSSQCNSA